MRFDDCRSFTGALKYSVDLDRRYSFIRVTADCQSRLQSLKVQLTHNEARLSIDSYISKQSAKRLVRSPTINESCRNRSFSTKPYATIFTTSSRTSGSKTLAMIALRIKLLEGACAAAMLSSISDRASFTIFAKPALFVTLIPESVFS